MALVRVCGNEKCRWHRRGQFGMKEGNGNGNGNGNGENQSASGSHGYCPGCLREQLILRIRKQQFREQREGKGSFPCFATANGYCDQPSCAFYTCCIKEYPSNAEIEELQRRLIERSQGRIKVLHASALTF